MTQLAFEGFEQANTTPVPDILFDELLDKLSGAELKVLLYIIRRTRGFKKDTDAISLTQFKSGITTKDGRKLDHGCGIKYQKNVVDALTSLEKKGYIEAIRTESPEGDKATTLYRIRFRKSEGVVANNYEVVANNYHPSSNKLLPVVVKDPLGVVAINYQQETVIQETVKQENTTPKGKSKNSLTLAGQHILDVYQTFKGRKSNPGKATIDAANGLADMVTSDEELIAVLTEIRDNEFLNKNQVARDLDFVFRKYEKYLDVVERKKKPPHNGKKQEYADDLPVFRAKIPIKQGVYIS